MLKEEVIAEILKVIGKELGTGRIKDGDDLDIAKKKVIKLMEDLKEKWGIGEKRKGDIISFYVKVMDLMKQGRRVITLRDCEEIFEQMDG